MKWIALLVLIPSLLACGNEPQEQAPASVAQRSAAAPAGSSATLSLAEVAGRWTMRAWTEAGDSIVGYELIATADSAGWTMSFPDRPPIPVRVVAVAADSIVTAAGPYQSMLREGVPVTLQTVYRLRDGRLVGRSVARYRTSGSDSVLHIRAEGTRTP